MNESKEIPNVFSTETDTNLEEKTFATLKAVKGRQFGKDVYSTAIQFKDLKNFLEIFPDVQRNIIPRKVNSLKKYILSGIEGNVNMRFFSAVTVTCKGHIFYSEDNSKLAIDIVGSKLSINDGQHRFEAIKTAIEYLEKEFVKSKDKLKTSRLKDKINELRGMIIPVVIFDGLSESEEKQLFHDLNNLAQRPSRNANIRLNQTDLWSRMAREISLNNKYLVHYGVEMDKSSIFGNNNKNTILLATIYASIRELLNYEYKYDNNFLNDNNYESFKDKVDDTFTEMFYALPNDINIRGKYLTDKSYSIRAISRFICHARNHLDLRLTDEQIFKAIHNVDWTYNLRKWSMYGGVEGADGNIVFGGGTSGGFKAVYNILYDTATEIVSKDRRGIIVQQEMSEVGNRA